METPLSLRLPETDAIAPVPGRHVRQNHAVARRSGRRGSRPCSPSCARASPWTRSASSGRFAGALRDLEQADRRLFLAERRASYVKDVFQPLEFHGAVHAQVRPRAARQRLRERDVHDARCRSARRDPFAPPGLRPRRCGCRRWPSGRSRCPWPAFPGSGARPSDGPARRRAPGSCPPARAGRPAPARSGERLRCRRGPSGRRPRSCASCTGLPAAPRGPARRSTCASIELRLIFSFSCSILLRFSSSVGLDLRDAGDDGRHAGRPSAADSLASA